MNKLKKQQIAVWVDSEWYEQWQNYCASITSFNPLYQLRQPMILRYACSELMRRHPSDVVTEIISLPPENSND